MNVLDAIMTRRNIKSFKPDPIDKDKVISWLNAASYAPNHRMMEPWEIYWIGPDTRAAVGHKTDFGGAPVVLAIVSTPAKNHMDRDEHIEAVACFIQNFMLAAHSEGAGTGWSSIGISPKVRALLQLQDGYECVGFIPVGYPNTIPDPKPRTPIQQKIHQLP